MSSYIQSFADFVQKKENDVNRVISQQEVEDDSDMPTPSETPTLPKSTNFVKKSPSLAHLQTSIGLPVGPVCNGSKMEHSYTRDTTGARQTADVSSGLAPPRTILVRRPPQCPSCHLHPLEEHEQEDTNRVPVPGYNELAAKDAMNDSVRAAKNTKNNNYDEDNWETRVNQLGWSPAQKSLFDKVVQILDDDLLGRLANAGRQHEPMQRRVIIDNSATRMRRVLSRIFWDSRLTQWLHATLMEELPASYMPSYLDIVQTLNSLLPTLMDKMLFGRPLENIGQDLLATIMKPQWEPMVNATKSRNLTHNAVIVAIPSTPHKGPLPNRLQQWYRQLAEMTQVVQVTLPMSSNNVARQPIEKMAEQIVSLARVKIQEIRTENAQRNIILLGFNAGAALAMQVAMSETVAAIVCLGFAYHTFNGVRGMPDDRMLDIKVPILFVIGQNSNRSSVEEMESLREKMISESTLVVVGSADDALRVPRSRRKIENVTQAMVDTMVVDEVYEFLNKNLTNPPGPRTASNYTGQVHAKHHGRSGVSQTTPGDGRAAGTPQQRKRKQEGLLETGEHTPGKARCTPGAVGRPRTRPLPTIAALAKSTPTLPLLAVQQRPQLLTAASHALPVASGGSSVTNDDLNKAIQSILDDNGTVEQQESFGSGGGVTMTPKQVTNFELVASSKPSQKKLPVLNGSQTLPTLAGSQSSANSVLPTKIKMIPSNQFVQLKPPMQSQSKIYTIKTSAMLNQTQVAAGGNSAAANIGSIVSTPSSPMPSGSSGQQQIFTLKSPNGKTTQFVTAASPSVSQQKYTVVKNATGSSTLQLSAKSAAAGGGVDFANIIDMPIIFADNDGNLTDAMAAGDGAGGEQSKSVPKVAQTTPKSSSSGVGQLIISQKIIREANSVTAGSTPLKVTVGQQQQLASPSIPKNMVFLNRNSMKPCPTIIGRSALATHTKYTKLLVQNHASPGSSPIVSAVKHVNIQSARTVTSTGSPALPIRPATTSTAGSGILNVTTKAPPHIQIIGSTKVAGSPATTGSMCSPGGTPPMRNIVLKHIPENLKSQLSNRNLTVRKLVNIVPANKAAMVGLVSTSSSGHCIGAPITTSAMQSSPKIITLNPINPSALAPMSPALSDD